MVLDLRRRGLASVPVYGRYKYNRASRALRQHRHAAALEICYLERGRQSYCVKNQRFLLRGGDIFLTYPGEIHSTGGEPQEKGLLYWISILEPEKTGGSLLGLSATQSLQLWRQLMKRQRRCFPGTPDMRRHLERISQLALSRPTPLARIEMANRLAAYLLALVQARAKASRPGQKPALDLVLRHIEANLEEPDKLRVARLAEVMALSVSRFKAAFKQQTGIPPAEYVLRARIAEAARRLAQRRASITEVAYSLGFSSSQYFASVFKRFTYVTPRRFASVVSPAPLYHV